MLPRVVWLWSIVAWALCVAVGGGLAQHSVERVSVATDGSQGNSGSSGASLSGLGRHVAFYSYARNLVSGDTNDCADVFVRDRDLGTTTRVSVATDGSQGSDHSMSPSISSDGRYVAFHSWATNLVSGDTNAKPDVFVHDRQTASTTRVSVASDGSQGWQQSFLPSVSADGRYVAFYSYAPELVAGDTNAKSDVFVRDLQAGTTVRVSVASDGTQGNGDSRTPSISADGRYVAFESYATNLVPGDTNGVWDVFVHDGLTATTTRVSVASDGSQGNGVSYEAAISGDGGWVTFQSDATDLVPNDTNGMRDIFVHDRDTGTTMRASVASDGTQGNDNSLDPSISGDGRYVAFKSSARDLVLGDANGTADIFMHDCLAHITWRISLTNDGNEADDESTDPAIALGSPAFVAFVSLASNLVSGDTNSWADVSLSFEQPLAVRWPR